MHLIYAPVLKSCAITTSLPWELLLTNTSIDACWQHLGRSCKAACPQHTDHKRPILAKPMRRESNQFKVHFNDPTYATYALQKSIEHLPSTIHQSLDTSCKIIFGLLAYNIIVDSLAQGLRSWWLHQHSPIWEVLHHQSPIFTMPGFQWLEMRWNALLVHSKAETWNLDLFGRMVR